MRQIGVIESLAECHQVSARHKLKKARPCLLIFKNYVIYKTNNLIGVYALRQISEIESLSQFCIGAISWR